jgi:hypothetical protein
MSPTQGRAGRGSRCSGSSGPSSTVGRPPWATPWATVSQVSRNAGQSIGCPRLRAAAGSMSQSMSKQTARPASSRARGASTVVLPAPDAPVTTNRASTAAAPSSHPQTGHRALPGLGPGSITTGSSHAWQSRTAR